MGQVGSGRPEKIEAPAMYWAGSVDLDVAMLDDHKGTKISVHTSVRRAGIRDQMSAVIHVGNLG